MFTVKKLTLKDIPEIDDYKTDIGISDFGSRRTRKAWRWVGEGLSLVGYEGDKV
jgi:hypothetical protein